MGTASVPETGKWETSVRVWWCLPIQPFSQTRAPYFVSRTGGTHVYIVVLAAADLRHGGLKGDGRFSPRTRTMGIKEKWDQMCLLSASSKTPGLSFFHSL